MKSGELETSLVTRLLSVAFFLVLSLSALTWFICSAVGVVSQFQQNAPVVTFDKGSMYMLGVGLGLSLLTIGGVMQGLLRKDLDHKRQKLFTRGLIISLMLMLAFPQLAHYVVSQKIKSQSYIVCSEVTYRWFVYSKFYYADNDGTCDVLADKKR